MDKCQDKQRVKKKTKIPLFGRSHPLLAPPNQSLKKISDRPPLNTLAGPNGNNNNVLTRFESNTQCFAGPSTSRDQSLINRPKSHLRVDTSIVTERCGHDDSYYNFVAFLDGEKSITEESIISISSVDEHDTKENETIREGMHSPDFLQKGCMASMEQEYSAEIFSYLLQVETKSLVLTHIDKESRALIINWLMEISGVNGNPATVQTAIWYLDAVLAMGMANAENMELVAAASYWIAEKVCGCITPATGLVEYANKTSTVQVLTEMEHSILLGLNFPRKPVIPQDYIRYFAWWCNGERPGEIEVAASFICLCVRMVFNNLCEEYPSVVAAVSTRIALLLLWKELIPRLQKCPTFVAAEEKAEDHYFMCFILLHSIRVVGANANVYRSTFEQYGMPPENIAQKIVNATREYTYEWLPD